MSNRAVKAIAGGIMVLLALPLIARALKSAPQIDAASQNPGAAVGVSGPVPAPVASPQPGPRRPSIMTEAQFSQISTGMTYADCVAFIGSEGKPCGRDPGGGSEYRWQLVSDASGAASIGEATLTFREGVLCGRGFSRNQSGRPSRPMSVSAALPAQRPAAPPYICRSVNNAIKDGADYAECARLLGMEGAYLGRMAASAGTRAPDGTLIPIMVDVYAWQNTGIPATLTLSFRDGKVTARQVSVGNMAGGG